MITPAYAQKMAAYNRWINTGIYDACEQLSDAQRREDCGAFFGSIHATLNHILWADQIWLHRIAGLPKPIAGSIPESLTQYEAWDDLRRERERFDGVIEKWAEGVDQASLEGNLVWYSAATGREQSHPRWIPITHLFNHQTHHRGQVHCMLTRFGVETPVTDLPFMPNS